MKIDAKRIPRHIAIIMDGNGRWAKAHKLPRIMGHREGVNAVERIMYAARDIGVKILTLYAFSTENWKRSKVEVDALMRLLHTYLIKKAEKLKKDGVKLNTIGDVSALPQYVRAKLDEVMDLTGANKSFVLNLALNYGGRAEILMATRSLCREVLNGTLNIDKVDEEMFSRHLYTSNLPDPDFMIRTSGEMRISNFLLWQMSYSEMYVTDKLWPDFKKTDFEKAIIDFQSRDRRYGGR